VPSGHLLFNGARGDLRVRRFVVSAVFGLLLGFLGPLLVGPRSQAASTPFVYQPPDGFVAHDAPEGMGTSGGKVWVFDEVVDRRPLSPDKSAGASVRVVLHHSAKQMSVEEADLAKLAGEMPKAFEDACKWVHRRHELRERSDGGRVGLIEGDCNKDVDFSALGLPDQTLRSRKLQLMFPDDGGTSIVTASYPTDQAARWEPVFEATINKARGVAVRVPPPAPWARLLWGLAGIVVGWLVTALVQKSSPAKPGPTKATAGAKDEDESESVT
jgi:hypothetical protein